MIDGQTVDDAAGRNDLNALEIATEETLSRRGLNQSLS